MSCTFNYVLCVIFAYWKIQEKHQSSIYLSIKFRAQEQIPMNSKEGENL